MAFHDLTVAKVDTLAPDAVALTFAIPPALEPDFTFQPGQFLTLRATVDGADIRRSYSIAGAAPGALTVGIRVVPEGAFSTFAASLRPGDRISVMAPSGRFVSADEDDLLLIAAGSGITPMMAIATHALARGARVTLVYGNRTSGTIMFRQALDDLKDRYLERFTLIHVLSRETQDVALFSGRVDGTRVAAMSSAGLIAPAQADRVFLCGPGEMIGDVSAALERLGVPASRIAFERFTVEEAPAPARPRHRPAAPQGVTVTVRLDGAERSFEMTDQDGNLVDAAARAGLELPYSCKGGMCCTCRCRVTDGTGDMARNYSLEPWEIEAGFTLACQTRPTTERIAVDFDAA